MRNIQQADAAIIQALGHAYALAGGDKGQLRLDLTTSSLAGAPVRVGDDGRVEVLTQVGDSYQASATPYSRDELVQVLTRVLEKRRAKLKARNLFRVNNELIPGHTSWRAYRKDYTGRPKPLGQGGNVNDIPVVSLNSEYESFPIEYYVIASRMNYQEQLAAQNVPSRINAEADKQAAARDALERYLDDLAWKGSDGNVRGLLENEWIALWTPQTTFKIGGTATDMYHAVVALVTLPLALNNVESEDGPDVMIISPRVDAALASTFFSDDSKYSVKQAILDNTTIEEIVTVGQFTGYGDAGEDAAMAVNSMEIELMPCMEPTPLPEEVHGLARTRMMVAAHGGVKVFDAMSHAIGLFNWEQGFQDL